jgi:hypothetical protein
MNQFSLLAIRQSRRAVAIIVFKDLTPDYAQLRHLSSDGIRAKDSAVEFVHWILNHFDVDSAAIEPLPDKDLSKRANLNRAILQTLRSEAVAVWPLTANELLEAFGYPPLKTREALRSLCAKMWPVIGRGAENDLLLDAAAAGLYVQTERLFLT